MLFRLDQLVRDARFGLRQLVRSPLVSTVAILTPAIGIGLNTAVFSLVNAVLLRPLPYPHSGRLVWIAPYHEPVDLPQPTVELVRLANVRLTSLRSHASEAVRHRASIRQTSPPTRFAAQ
jgi:hypothetical protein